MDINHVINILTLIYFTKIKQGGFNPALEIFSRLRCQWNMSGWMCVCGENCAFGNKDTCLEDTHHALLKLFPAWQATTSAFFPICII
jgi:hypothetical protein